MDIPQLKSGDEFKSILSNFNGDPQEIENISNEVADKQSLEVDGISIKNMMLAIEIALQKSSKQEIEFNNFMESLESI